MNNWFPGAHRRPISTNVTAGGMGRITTFVPHCQVGNGALFAQFNDPASRNSTHLWLSKEGRFEQYVSFSDRAWAQGPGNPYCVSCECEGFPGEPYTREQLRGLADFFAWGCGVWGWPLKVTDRRDDGGIGAHRVYMATECPGDVRAGQRAEILARAKGVIGGDDVTEQDKADIANRVLAGLRTQVFDVSPPIRQGNAGQVIGATYNKAGDLQSSVARLLRRVDFLYDQLARLAPAAGVALDDPPWRSGG